MRPLYAQAPEREIGEIGVELRLWMAREKARPRARFDRPLGPADHGQSRMGQRIALAALGEQKGGARIAFEVERMGGQLRHQEERRSVEVRRDRNQRGERKPSVPIKGRERAGAERAQELFGESRRIKILRGRGLFVHRSSTLEGLNPCAGGMAALFVPP
jgi:hypothetical protein